MSQFRFSIRDLLWAMVVVAVVLGWRADRFIYTARNDMREKHAAVRDWQATQLWGWAQNSDFVKSIESNETSITIETKDGKVDVLKMPPYLVAP
jgi:hypothetical protein